MARYELTEQQWQRIEPLLPPLKSGKRGHPYLDHRPIINGILWVLNTGAPWADLPERYGPHQTVYDRFVRWQRCGLWQELLVALQACEDAYGRLHWHYGAGDSTIIPAHPTAATVGAYPQEEEAQEPAQKGGKNRTTRQSTRSKSKLSGAAEAGRRPRSTCSPTTNAVR
jgi:transposase